MDDLDGLLDELEALEPGEDRDAHVDEAIVMRMFKSMEVVMRDIDALVRQKRRVQLVEELGVAFVAAFAMAQTSNVATRWREACPSFVEHYQLTDRHPVQSMAVKTADDAYAADRLVVGYVVTGSYQAAEHLLKKLTLCPERYRLSKRLYYTVYAFAELMPPQCLRHVAVARQQDALYPVDAGMPGLALPAVGKVAIKVRQAFEGLAELAHEQRELLAYIGRGPLLQLMDRTVDTERVRFLLRVRTLTVRQTKLYDRLGVQGARFVGEVLIHGIERILLAGESYALDMAESDNSGEWQLIVSLVVHGPPELLGMDVAVVTQNALRRAQEALVPTLPAEVQIKQSDVGQLGARLQAQPVRTPMSVLMYLNLDERVEHCVTTDPNLVAGCPEIVVGPPSLRGDRWHHKRLQLTDVNGYPVVLDVVLKYTPSDGLRLTTLAMPALQRVLRARFEPDATRPRLKLETASGWTRVPVAPVGLALGSGQQQLYTLKVLASLPTPGPEPAQTRRAKDMVFWQRYVEDRQLAEVDD
jgi:hypothetical protein